MSRCDICGRDPSELDEPCEECGLDYIPTNDESQTFGVNLVKEDERHYNNEEES